MTDVIRPARLEDAGIIHNLIARYASRGDMLSRAVKEIEETIEEYCVAEVSGRVVGSCALHLYSMDWAEVKALAVQEEFQGRGLAFSMVKDRVQAAKEMGVRRAFCLTYIPELFVKHGFELIPKEALPHKIWAECIRCEKFSDCDENALALSLDGKPLR